MMGRVRPMNSPSKDDQVKMRDTLWTPSETQL